MGNPEPTAPTPQRGAPRWPTSVDETWQPGPGNWACVAHEDGSGGVPQSVSRVLVIECSGSHPVDTCRVAWTGAPGPDGKAHGTIAAGSLRPVTPRVWRDPGQVPRHVVTRNRHAQILAGAHIRHEEPGDGPWTEVLPED